MSIKAMSWAWEQDIPPGDKYMLLALADHANDEDYTCWPSVAHLQRKTSLNRTSVWRIIDRLVEGGAVSRVGTHAAGSTTYKIHVGAPCTYVHKATQVGAPSNEVGALCNEVGAPRTPNHKNHHEPSLNHHSLSGLPPDASKQTRINGHNNTAKSLLLFLNEKTGRNYQPVKANLEMISARLKEGASERQCRLVVLRKFHDWGNDEKMSEYLRPATLFNRTKFAQYVGEIPEEEGNG